MDELLKMNPQQKIYYFQNITRDQFELLLREKSKILKMDSSSLNMLFLNIPNEYKKMMIDDLQLFEKLMLIPANRLKRSIMDLSDREIREYIYRHPNLYKCNVGKNVLESHLKKLNLEEFSQVLEIPELEKLYSGDMLEQINQNYTLTSYQFMIVENAISSGRFNVLSLFKITNGYELFIYAKFGMLVQVQNVIDGYLVIADTKIKYDFVERVNRKHILSLIELLKQKENNTSNNQLFITVLKVYMAFGYDNSKKIIQDFFTYSTSASLKRAGDELFKDTRRDFRLKNQNKFYYYGIEFNFKKAVRENDLSFFETFCGRGREYAEVFLMNLKKELQGLDEDAFLVKIKEIILSEIQKREKYYYQLDSKKYQRYYDSLKRVIPIGLQDLYRVFSDIDLNYVLTNDGKIIPDEELTKFLLGNCKWDNDCILRMVLNHQALGLNDELYQIMNRFEKIKEAIHREAASSESDLSLYSILDVIDISKIFLYDLKPDELDITLETLSKILKSRKYCTEPPEVILERTLELHKKRKWKISCAIPMIHGKYQGAKYWMPKFDEESLLASGIDAGSCFKVGGKGEDFFEFCLTNSNGAIFYIEYMNVKYLLPSTVNGNMLNINSIDPRISDEAIYRGIMDVIKEMSRVIVEDDNNQIELVTITDIHHENFMSSDEYSAIEFEKFLPMGTDVYCDYNKKDVTNYIVYQKHPKTKPVYFDNQDLFYQDRSIPYVITPEKEYDKERISILLNLIAYSSIDFLSISESEKESLRLYYNSIPVEDFTFIIGNQDWFIGITKDNEIISYLLPYDKRAIVECKKYTSFIKEFMSKIDGVSPKKR